MGEIIVVGGEKGGVQKSGLSQSLAIWYANEQGKDTLLVDADPQGTTWDWYQIRLENKDLAPISCVQMSGKMHQELKNQASRYEVVIVDVGGHDSKPLRSAMAVADKMLVPLRPKRRDLKTLEHMMELIEQVQAINTKLKVKAVFTQCPSLPSQAQRIHAAKQVSRDYGLIPLEGITMMRNVYDDCDEGGKTVFETDDKKAIEEITIIAKELETLKESTEVMEAM